MEITAGILGRWGRDPAAGRLGRLVARKVREVIAVLERNGWVLVRERGSHRHFRHPDVPFVVTVAGKPSSTVRPGTLASIRRLSGIEEIR